MNDEQLLRYSRHLLLAELGVEGQARLAAAHVLLIGAGGLGCPAALYLASGGVGRLTIADPDVVDATNLQRHLEGEEEDKPAPGRAAPDGKEGVQAPATPPKPIELGSPEDFQLQQALAHLKGQPVLAEPKKKTVAQNKSAQ